MPNVQLFVRDTTTNKNVPLEVDSSNKLSVKDATAQASLTSINSALGGTLTVSDSTSQGTLSSISSTLGGTLTVSDSTAQSSLSTINSTLGGTLTVSDSGAQLSLTSIDSALSGTLQVSDSTAQLSLTSIDSALTGTLTVSDSTAQSTLSNIHTALSGTLTTSSGVSRTNGNLNVSSSVTNGDVSSTVDANNFKRAVVFGNLGADGDVLIQVSNDGSNWYEDFNSNFYSNFNTYDLVGRFECTARYWRVKYNISGTVTVRYALMA